MSKRKRRKNRRSSNILRLEYALPHWTPTAPSPAVDALLECWKHRDLTDEADDQIAPGTQACPMRWGERAGVPLAVLREVWLTEENNFALRCQLCEDSPLICTGFGHAIFNGGILRTCPLHTVLYVQHTSTGAIHRWLGRVLPPRLFPDRWSARISIGRQSLPRCEKPESGWPASQWVRRAPRGAGRYLVAALDGRTAATRLVLIDGETGIAKPENDAPCWWWSTPVPEGWPGLDREAGLVGYME